MPTVHLLIKGKVQGVFYKASAKDAAERMHISGWIKNTPEGHVEALASGAQEELRRFVEWCKKGPERAVVTDVIELRGDASDGGAMTTDRSKADKDKADGDKAGQAGSTNFKIIK